MNKEDNFISAVVYVRNEAEFIAPFFGELYEQLDAYFSHFEIIAVNDASTDSSHESLKAVSLGWKQPLTIVNMNIYRGREECMNAGLDLTIGDFVYEFDSVREKFPVNLIYESYQCALTGMDAVSVCPKKQAVSSKLFYAIFNVSSDVANKIRSEAFHLISRRLIHRMRAVSDYAAYRKAGIAACGLKVHRIIYDGKMRTAQYGKMKLAVDSLLLYTQAGYRVSLCISLLNIILIIVGMLYTVIVYFMGVPMEGWTTTCLFLLIGFAGIAILATIIIKYLDLLLKLCLKRQYLVENIEKYPR